MARFIGRLGWRFTLSTLATLAVAGGIAYAAIPDAGTATYHACMLKNLGTIRIIDPSLPTSSLLQHCTSLETAITFNQQGAKGNPGGQGIQGIQGPPGTPGAVSTVPGPPGQPGSPGTDGFSCKDAVGAIIAACKGPQGDPGKDGTLASLNDLAGESCTTYGGSAGTITIATSATNTVTFVCSAAATLPASPTGLTATSPASNEADLQWAPVAGATSYTIYRSTTSGSGYSKAGVRPDTSFTDIGLNASQTYYYVVQASNAAGNSPDSLEVSATTSALPVFAGYLFTPSVACSSSAGVLILSWSPATGSASGYEVGYGLTKDGAFEMSHTATPDITITPTTFLPQAWLILRISDVAGAAWTAGPVTETCTGG